MLDFDGYLERKKVLKREKDSALKESLLNKASERISQLSIKEIKLNFKFEQAYESVRELTDAFLARDGYKTYSHEAALTYLKKLSLITDAELERIDVCRKKRHDLIYYGKEFDDEEYKTLLSFLKTIFNKLKPSLK